MGNSIGLFLQLGGNGKSRKSWKEMILILLNSFSLLRWFPGVQELALRCQSPQQAFFQISHDQSKLKYHDK